MDEFLTVKILMLAQRLR